MDDIDRLARFLCHKVVRAGRITSTLDDYQFTARKGHISVTVADGGSIWLPIPAGATRKPKPGDYYVVYDDGYTSLSPAKAFEEGYTLISEPQEAAATHGGPHHPAQPAKLQGLPVEGYRDQTAQAVALVNENKKLEEVVLQALDALAKLDSIDKRWLAIGRTSLEQAFMAVNRAIFQPERVKL